MSVEVIIRFRYRESEGPRSPLPRHSTSHDDGFSVTTGIRWQVWCETPDEERRRSVAAALQGYPRDELAPMAAVYTDASFPTPLATWGDAVQRGAEQIMIDEAAAAGEPASSEADSEMEAVFESMRAIQAYHGYMAEHPEVLKNLEQLTLKCELPEVLHYIAAIPDLAPLIPALNRDRFFEAMLRDVRLTG